MIESVDRDGNGTLNFDEFIVLMSRGAKRGIAKQSYGAHPYTLSKLPC